MSAERLVVRSGGDRGRSVARGGVVVTSVRRPAWRASGGREGLLVIFRRHLPAPWGRGTFNDLVPVFAEGRCPATRRRGDVRELAAAAMAAAVPRMATLVPPLHAATGIPDLACDRDALLTARAAKRQAVQRGLFDRRAERDADAAELAVAADAAAPAANTPPPEPLLLLLVTS